MPPPPPSDISGGAKTTPRFDVLVKTLLVHKTWLYILGYAAYTFNRVVDASKGNILKKALKKGTYMYFMILPQIQMSDN